MESILTTILADEVDSKIRELRAEVETLRLGWGQHIPSLLAALSAANAQNFGTDALERRFSAIRRDIERLASRLDMNVLDMRSRIDLSYPYPRTAAAPESPNLCIVSLGRVGHALANGLHLHYCGSTGAPVTDAVNIGNSQVAGVDIVASPITPLPFGPGVVASITVSSGLGMFSLEDFRAQILPRWADLLSAGGILRIAGIDMEAALTSMAAGGLDPETLLQMIRREGRILPSDGQILGEGAIRNALVEAGFELENLDSLHRESAGLFQIQARKREGE